MTRGDRESLIRKTAAGAVRGARDGEVLSWKGIPFAAAPTGNRRFRRPQPPAPWHELRDATAFGAMAPQHVLKSMDVDPSVPLSEDCLTVNVWAPAGAAAPAGAPGGAGASGAAGRPVMVWIHGGGYFAGSTAQRFYDATTLAAEGDVVVVTVNYRLGILGFVDFSSLNRATGESFGHGFDANVGLRDQIAGLTWVQQNIAAFGGDPGNVTLFGESAGGASVIALMASPLTAGLFHRAIAQSAPVTSVYGRERAATVAHRFLDIVGIEPGDAHRLRELDPFDLVDAGAELVHEVSGSVPGTLAMAPVIDDEVVPEYPLTAFREGHVPRLPLIIGTNRDESSFFKLMRSPLLPITSEKIEQMFAEIAADNPGAPGFDEAGARITSAYPSYPRRRTPAEVSRDAGFRMPSIWLAEAHSRNAPTWMYRFDHATPLLKVTGIGATHAAELAYVFGSFAPRGRDIVFGLGGRPEALRVAGRMRGRWIAFARGEAPELSAGADPDAAGSDDVVPWPPYDPETRPTLIIDREERVEHDPDGEIREAWGPEILAFR
ncbi:carboxylesterase/lipase family protein [Herbiconiux sp. VKM Ac-1786]|uniref:carboxylesterase/lipase family protein n=1 Tax=Herbiconiux sp. VKM Ac-1786 TaxID=2783824 RepID=UPI00188C4E5F|nr:carboxylesterase/lipase family protein [Herbiconiux sp. VKM Ac-1786]MBF4571713.1 carboxylesterase/lipase family protein [Herbiconiux sp. VKM Ac-1786]